MKHILGNESFFRIAFVNFIGNLLKLDAVTLFPKESLVIEILRTSNLKEIASSGVGIEKSWL